MSHSSPAGGGALLGRVRLHGEVVPRLWKPFPLQCPRRFSPLRLPKAVHHVHPGQQGRVGPAAGWGRPSRARGGRFSRRVLAPLIPALLAGAEMRRRGFKLTKLRAAWLSPSWKGLHGERRGGSRLGSVPPGSSGRVPSSKTRPPCAAGVGAGDTAPTP